MKTKIELELETKDLKKVYPEEYLGDVAKCPKEDQEICQESMEEALHRNFTRYIHDCLEDDNDLMQEAIMQDEASIEGFEELGDYGFVKISFKPIKDEK